MREEDSDGGIERMSGRDRKKERERRIVNYSDMKGAALYGKKRNATTSHCI